ADPPPAGPDVAPDPTPAAPAPTDPAELADEPDHPVEDAAFPADAFRAGLRAALTAPPKEAAT
ncbi:MAG TPA: hypothetical protein VGD67_12180, partial [Pseudonocardiaceae bacterium]